MHSRVVTLTLLVPSVSIWNVWDLPIWAWRSYAALVDDYRKKQGEEDKR